MKKFVIQSYSRYKKWASEWTALKKIASKLYCNHQPDTKRCRSIIFNWEIISLTNALGYVDQHNRTIFKTENQLSENSKQKKTRTDNWKQITTMRIFRQSFKRNKRPTVWPRTHQVAEKSNSNFKYSLVRIRSNQYHFDQSKVRASKALVTIAATKPHWDFHLFPTFQRVTRL